MTTTRIRKGRKKVKEEKKDEVRHYKYLFDLALIFMIISFCFDRPYTILSTSVAKLKLCDISFMLGMSSALLVVVTGWNFISLSTTIQSSRDCLTKDSKEEVSFAGNISIF